MTSKKTGDENEPENSSEDSQSDNASDASSDTSSETPSSDEQSAEEVAKAAIDAAQASASEEDDAASDPLGFDDARMPEADLDGVDLSADKDGQTDSETDSKSDDDKDAKDGDEEGEDGDAESEPDLETQLAAANAKVDDHWARILRMQADLENERKRTQKQVSSAHKFAIEKFAEELLPIKDSLEMGLTAAEADDADLAKIVEGSELTLKLLTQAFEKNQIVEVDPMDEKFDPNVHQAMSMQEAEGKEANIVIGVMQKGYTLNDRLIRPALVTVSK